MVLGTFLLWYVTLVVQPEQPLRLDPAVTIFDKPVLEDGTLDAAAALAEHFKPTVPPAQNAAAMLARVLYPAKPTKEWDSVVGQLGLTVPPDEKDRLPDLEAFLKTFPEAPSIFAANEALYEINKLPWNADDHPWLAAYLKACEPALALAQRASQMPVYQMPCHIDLQAESMLMDRLGLVPGLVESRRLANLLLSRAMLRLGGNDTEGAWQDAMTLNRLARLKTREPFWINYLVACSLEGSAQKLTLAILNHSLPSSAQARQMEQDLALLPSLASFAETVRRERIFMIDLIQNVNQGGLETWLGLNDKMRILLPDRPSAPEALLAPSWVRAWFLDRQLMQEQYHRMAEAGMVGLTQTSYADYQNWWKGEKIGNDRSLARANRILQSPTCWPMLAALPSQCRRAVGSRVLLSHLMFSGDDTFSFSKAPYFHHQKRDFARLSVALAVCRLEKGKYPATLQELVPVYLPEVPKDRFSGQNLLYHPLPNAAQGYLLYSVGHDLVDDHGKEEDQADLVVRVQHDPSHAP